MCVGWGAPICSYAAPPPPPSQIGGAAHTAYMKAGCDRLPSLVTQWQNNACRGPLIAGRVEVPMRALEEALVNALDTIGYRTEYRGLYNDERAFVVEQPQPLEGAGANATVAAAAPP